MSKIASVKKWITTYPFVVGGLIGLIMMATIFAIVIWFPHVSDAWDRHQKMVRSIWCTVGLFALSIYHLWHWRHRRGFWLSLSIFFVLHVLGVFLYSIYVHPLVLQEWVVLLLLEAFVLVFFLNWVLQRFDRHGRANIDSANEPS